MSDTLAPTLKPLDVRVLDVLSDKGQRSDRVAQLLYGAPAWRCTACGKSDDFGRTGPARRPLVWEAKLPTRCWVTHGCHEGATSHPVLIASPEDVRTVREILRGLERIGKAEQRGGWWRRV